jgi:Asp-tRNA(Asn)/Glu-tRNA(Gln) amidotransferase C subunit
MKHYIQLKDGVVFNYHQSPENVDDSGPNVWEVDEEASSKLGMKYDPNTKVFSEAEMIKYAKLNEENIIVLINETKYASEVKDDIIITDPQVQVLWQWDGEKFIDIIEKNNLEENERYVKSLEKLANEAEELANSNTEPVEEIVTPLKHSLIKDGEEIVFDTAEELLAYVSNLEHENELKMQELLQNGTVVEDV